LFDGTPLTWNQILWRYNQETFNVAPIEWFFNEYYYPGLLGEIFAGKRPKVAEDISRKDRRQPVVKLSLADPTGAIATGISARTTKVKIEITDAEGSPFRVSGGGSSNGTGFGIPEDAPEGVITVRIGNSKYGKGQYTEPFTFTVTNEPLPVELITSWMKSVAPGQWLDLQTSNSQPLKHSELTEVAFKQAGRTIIVAAPKPFRPHVAVPSVLSSGDVELQMRTWRDGRPSEWSEAVVFKLADKPLAPSIGAIRLATGGWTQLWPGPDRETSFNMSPGDEVVLNGLWPVADASKLRVSLVRPGEVVTMTAKDEDEKANWFSDVRVRLPQSLEVGEWRMIVTSETDGTQDEVPIVIHVVSAPKR
jgi:hypothetical protein